MAKKIKGGCQCGEVRYEVRVEPAMVGHCHCVDCRKSSGSGHLTGAGFPVDKVKIAGKLKSFKSKSDSKATTTRKFCPKCGSRISLETTSWPGMILLTAGSMDDPSNLKPSMALFGKRRLAWDHVDPGVQTFDKMPPP